MGAPGAGERLAVLRQFTPGATVIGRVFSGMAMHPQTVQAAISMSDFENVIVGRLKRGWTVTIRPAAIKEDWADVVRACALLFSMAYGSTRDSTPNV
jgi:hypothetical protein